MDQAARQDIAAAAAAHRELGREYDEAVAEGLVERIGVEIDKRIDTRLGPSPRRSRPPAKASAVDNHEGLWAGVAIGAGITGLVAMLGGTYSSHHIIVPWVVGIWIVLVLARLGPAVVRRYRRQDRD
ncbi:MAG TPA: hypothetical protein VGI66_07010 [Streptosporangiaceae bacterium]